MKQTTEKTNTKTETPKVVKAVTKVAKPKVAKPKVTKPVKVVKPKEEMNYITVYAGGIGKKAISENKAVAICKEYIAAGKTKKAFVYVFVKEVK